MFPSQWPASVSLDRMTFKLDPRWLSVTNEHRQAGQGTRLVIKGIWEYEPPEAPSPRHWCWWRGCRFQIHQTRSREMVNATKWERAAFALPLKTFFALATRLAIGILRSCSQWSGVCALRFGFWHQPLFNSRSILITMFTKFPATVAKKSSLTTMARLA
jgi:hypothetical protein